MNYREIMQQALQALEDWAFSFPEAVHDGDIKLVDNLRAALADTEPEPVAWINVTDRKLEWSRNVKWETATTGVYDRIPLYTNPTKRKPLTDEQIRELFLASGFTVKEGLTDLKPYVYAAARAVEKAHGIKGVE